jgi:glucose/arabinose dehydrogenase/azurin
LNHTRLPLPTALHRTDTVNLFASEEQFPVLANPVQMAWDTKGRLWVAAWPNYPERRPDSKIGDSLQVFEDVDGDGKADKVTEFVGDLNCPTGFQFYKDGVLLVQAPDLWFLRDTDGDGKADWKERILMGLDSADSHHTANAVCLDPGGAIYLSDGVFHRTQIETARGPVRNDDGAIYRFEPRTGKFETYVAYGFANPHGRVFDYWGNDLVTDATRNNTYFAPAFSGHIAYPMKHAGMREFWDRPSRPCPATGILSSRHFPEELQENFLNLNVISFQGNFNVKVTEEGSGLKGTTQPNLISSTDPNFRPIAVAVGPDGALYFADSHKPLIGHMQHHLRDPNRDDRHGRIYRITWPGRPLLKPAKIDGQPIEALLELLKEPENGTRELTKIELGERDTAAVIAAVKQWAARLDSNDPAYQHHLMEALWVHQWHNVVNVEWLDRMLKSPEPRARAAAARVLCYWRDRVPDSLQRFMTLATDSLPRVRLEAVRAASFYRDAAAADVALADGSFDTVWSEAAGSPATLTELLNGIPLLNDADFRAKALDRVMPLLKTLPADLVAQAKAKPAGEGRFVRIELPRRGTLTLAEVQVLSEGRNIATQGKATQSSVSNGGDASRAIDGRTDGSFGSGTQTHSVENERNPWWEVDLGGNRNVEDVVVWNRTEGDLGKRLEGFTLIVLGEGRREVFKQTGIAAPSPSATLKVGGDPLAALQRSAIRASVSLNSEHEAVFKALTALIEKGEQVPTAARALRALPPVTWPKDSAGSAAQAIGRWAASVPVASRTAQDFVETVQTAKDMAGYLPAAPAAALRKELKDLGVAVFVIRTVREQMRYDIPRLVVEPGKPFEIILENDDFMPHNLVFVQPGTREAVATRAATMKPEQLDFQGRAYIPDSKDVFAGTRLLDAGQRQTLKVTAPTTPGTYEYVCTFPGHWTLMWGTLVVTPDVDAYLAANPVAQAASAAPAGE